MSKYYSHNIDGLRKRLIDLEFKEAEGRELSMDLSYMAVDLDKKIYFTEDYPKIVLEKFDYKAIPLEGFIDILLALERDIKIDNILNNE